MSLKLNILTNKPSLSHMLLDFSVMVSGELTNITQQDNNATLSQQTNMCHCDISIDMKCDRYHGQVSHKGFLLTFKKTVFEVGFTKYDHSYV